MISGTGKKSQSVIMCKLLVVRLTKVVFRHLIVRAGLLYPSDGLQGERSRNGHASEYVEKHTDRPEAEEQSEVCPMRNLPFGGGNACYTTVLEHN